MHRRFVACLGLVLVLAIFVRADGGDDSAAYTLIKCDDRAELERGEWRVVGLISYGTEVSKKLLEMHEMRMVFKGNKLTVRQNGQVYENTLTLDSKGRTKVLDWDENQGIYHLDKDELKIALGRNERPKDFAGQGNTEVYTLKRVKP